VAEKEYQRLSRAQRRPGVGLAVSAGFSSLWLGKDHLLTIESTGYTEEYKRFYYRDIQAITIRKTRRQAVLGIVMGIITLIFAMLGVYFGTTPGDDAGSIFCWIVAGVLGVLFVINLAAGPTTTCYLRSAVQTEELPSLGRWRRANKALARLRPYIIAAQGELAPGEVALRMQEMRSNVAPANAVPANETPPGDLPPVLNA